MTIKSDIKYLRKEKEVKKEEKEARKIVNSKEFKGLVKAGFSERKAFKIIRGY